MDVVCHFKDLKRDTALLLYVIQKGTLENI